MCGAGVGLSGLCCCCSSGGLSPISALSRLRTPTSDGVPPRMRKKYFLSSYFFKLFFSLYFEMLVLIVQVAENFILNGNS